MANRVILTGRLTEEPELRQTPDGTPVTSVSIAVPRKFKKDTADFLDVVAWRKTAEFLCRYFTKGKWMEVDGSIQTRTYQDREGKKRKAVEIVADEINFVGDKPKNEAAPSVPGAHSPAPPISAPAGFDPFGQQHAPPPTRFLSGQMAPAYASGSADDFYVSESDDDGDLPF